VALTQRIPWCHAYHRLKDSPGTQLGLLQKINSTKAKNKGYKIHSGATKIKKYDKNASRKRQLFMTTMVKMNKTTQNTTAEYDTEKSSWQRTSKNGNTDT